MLNIHGQKGNANQNNTEISLYSSHNGYHEEHKSQQMLMRMRGWGGTLTHCWWECKLVQLLWKAVWRFLKILKIELPYNPVIPLLGIYLKKCK
jgi:hypothetical protein